MQRLAVNGWDEELDALVAGNAHVSKDDVQYFRQHCATVIAGTESAIKTKMAKTDVMDVVVFKPDQVGAFIGAGGTGINNVMEEHSVQIIVEHHRKCFVIGPPEAVAAAAAYIRDFKLQLEGHNT